MSHKPHYPTGTILQSIGELNSLPFNREDVYEVIKEHPGLSTREILSFLGLAVSTHQDKQRLGGFLRNIKSAASLLILLELYSVHIFYSFLTDSNFFSRMG